MEFKYNFHDFADVLCGAHYGLKLANNTEKVMAVLPTEWARCKEVSEIIGVYGSPWCSKRYIVPPSLVGRILKDIMHQYPDLVECKMEKQEITYIENEFMSTDAHDEPAMIDVYDKDGNYVGVMGNPKFDRTTANRGSWIEVEKHKTIEVPYYRRKA